MAFSGGAPAVVSQVFSYIQAQAAARASEVTSAAAALNTSIGATPRLPSPVRLEPLDVNPPSSYTLPSDYALTVDDIRDQFGDRAAETALQLSADYLAFLDKWFPTASTYIGPAVDWVVSTLSVGGTGINAAVEAQLWARERARVLKESTRASDEAMSTWVGRGFSMPPGMLVHQLATIDRDAQDRVGEGSRTQAIKSFDTEIENVRLAVARAFTLQQEAIAGASKYMLDFLSAPQQALATSRLDVDTNTALVNSFISYYAQELALGQQQFGRDRVNAELTVQKDTSVFTGEIALLTARAQAAQAALQAFSQQAAAALNGLHAQGSVSGVDQTIQNI
jgi:hypothetical protein